MSLQALLVITYHKNEKYIDQCLEIIDKLWENHPPTWVLSDQGRFRYKSRIAINSRDWVHVVNQGIIALLSNGSIQPHGHILLLIEDHVPVRPIAVDTMNQLVEFIKQKDIKYLSLAGHGRGDEHTRIKEEAVYIMRRDVVHYSALHPAIWEVGHLLNTCNEALIRGCLDPWCFEMIQLPDADHFTTDWHFWPSAFGGFLAGGRINITAVRQMQHPALFRLRIRLIADWLLSLPSDYGRRAYKRIQRSRA